MTVCSEINRLILRREGELASISRHRRDHEGDNSGQDRDRDRPAASCQQAFRGRSWCLFYFPIF